MPAGGSHRSVLARFSEPAVVNRDTFAASTVFCPHGVDARMTHRASVAAGDLLGAARSHGAASADGWDHHRRHVRRDGDEADVPDRRVRSRKHLAYGRHDRPLRAVVRLRPRRPAGAPATVMGPSRPAIAWGRYPRA